MLETDRKIVLNDVKIDKIDIVVQDDSDKKYVVEVKTGKLDVTGVRQAYTNTLVLLKESFLEVQDPKAAAIGLQVFSRIVKRIQMLND